MGTTYCSVVGVTVRHTRAQTERQCGRRRIKDGAIGRLHRGQTHILAIVDSREPWPSRTRSTLALLVGIYTYPIPTPTVTICDSYPSYQRKDCILIQLNNWPMAGELAEMRCN